MCSRKPARAHIHRLVGPVYEKMIRRENGAVGVKRDNLSRWHEWSDNLQYPLFCNRRCKYSALEYGETTVIHHVINGANFARHENSPTTTPALDEAKRAGVMIVERSNKVVERFTCLINRH